MRFVPLQPIFLRSFGRTGTTLLMQLLGSSEQVVFDKKYPYENRLITYFYRLLTLPFQEKPKGVVWNNDSIFNPKFSMMGPLPLETELIEDPQRFQNDAFLRLWNAFSAEVYRTKVDARYYAEKIPHDIPPVLNTVMECRNIFLLRDPRDEMVSIMEFNKKRGNFSFGWHPDDTPETFARRHVRDRKAFMQHFYRLEQSDQQLKVRYEDLVTDIEAEARRISVWLGVPLNAGNVIENQEKHKHHMTSIDPQASIGRWREALAPEVQKIFVDFLGEELRQSGYDV